MIAYFKYTSGSTFTLSGEAYKGAFFVDGGVAYAGKDTSITSQPLSSTNTFRADSYLNQFEFDRTVSDVSANHTLEKPDISTRSVLSDVTYQRNLDMLHTNNVKLFGLGVIANSNIFKFGADSNDSIGTGFLGLSSGTTDIRNDDTVLFKNNTEPIHIDPYSMTENVPAVVDLDDIISGDIVIGDNGDTFYYFVTTSTRSFVLSGSMSRGSSLHEINSLVPNTDRFHYVHYDSFDKKLWTYAYVNDDLTITIYDTSLYESCQTTQVYDRQLLTIKGADITTLRTGRRLKGIIADKSEQIYDDVPQPVPVPTVIKEPEIECIPIVEIIAPPSPAELQKRRVAHLNSQHAAPAPMPEILQTYLKNPKPRAFGAAPGPSAGEESARHRARYAAEMRAADMERRANNPGSSGYGFDASGNRIALGPTYAEWGGDRNDVGGGMGPFRDPRSIGKPKTVTPAAAKATMSAYMVMKLVQKSKRDLAVWNHERQLLAKWSAATNADRRDPRKWPADHKIAAIDLGPTMGPVATALVYGNPGQLGDLRTVDPSKTSWALPKSASVIIAARANIAGGEDTPEFLAWWNRYIEIDELAYDLLPRPSFSPKLTTTGKMNKRILDENAVCVQKHIARGPSWKGIIMSREQVSGDDHHRPSGPWVATALVYGNPGQLGDLRTVDPSKTSWALPKSASVIIDAQAKIAGGRGTAQFLDWISQYIGIENVSPEAPRQFTYDDEVGNRILNDNIARVKSDIDKGGRWSPTGGVSSSRTAAYYTISEDMERPPAWLEDAIFEADPHDHEMVAESEGPDYAAVLVNGVFAGEVDPAVASLPREITPRRYEGPYTICIYHKDSSEIFKKFTKTEFNDEAIMGFDIRTEDDSMIVMTFVSDEYLNMYHIDLSGDGIVPSPTLVTRYRESTEYHYQPILNDKFSVSFSDDDSNVFTIIDGGFITTRFISNPEYTSGFLQRPNLMFPPDLIFSSTADKIDKIQMKFNTNSLKSNYYNFKNIATATSGGNRYVLYQNIGRIYFKKLATLTSITYNIGVPLDLPYNYTVNTSSCKSSIGLVINTDIQELITDTISILVNSNIKVSAGLVKGIPMLSNYEPGSTIEIDPTNFFMCSNENLNYLTVSRLFDQIYSLQETVYNNII